MRNGAMHRVGCLLACGALAAGVAVGRAAQKCPPPEEMKAKFTERPSADSLDDLGVWFADHEEFECAADAFATSLQTDPRQKDFRHVVFEFGASLYYSGDMKEAADALKEAERVGYRDAKLHVMLASALDAQHDGSGAVTEWRQALEFDPDSAVALDALSNDLVAARQWDDTVDLLEQPRVQALRSAKQIENLGTALVALGRPEQAAKELADGLNTYAGSKEIAQQLAGVLTALHRDAEAALVLKLAESQAPAAEAAQ